MITWRGTLLHLTHYDPAWLKRKKTERRFHMRTMLKCMDAAADSGMNMVILDIEDGVVYKSLPHIKKSYSAPMADLKKIVQHARKRGLEVVPKLNFATSTQHKHSAWLWSSQRQADSAVRWKEAMLAIDEIIAVVKPKIMHVGMDEDDTRSPDEYLKACLRLHRELKRRKVRMMMWAEVGHNWRAQQRWKEEPALKVLPRDILLLPWSYQMSQDKWTGKLKKMGYEVLGACGYGGNQLDKEKNSISLKNPKEWLATVKKHKADGLVLTQWINCSLKNAPRLIEGIRECGKLFCK